MDYLKEKQWKLEKYHSTTMIMHEGKADAKRNAKLEWCQTNNGKNRNTLVVWENIHMEHTYNQKRGTQFKNTQIRGNKNPSKMRIIFTKERKKSRHEIETKANTSTKTKIINTNQSKIM